MHPSGVVSCGLQPEERHKRDRAPPIRGFCAKTGECQWAIFSEDYSLRPSRTEFIPDTQKIGQRNIFCSTKPPLRDSRGTVH